jgi:hypothetical protein
MENRVIIGAPIVKSGLAPFPEWKEAHNPIAFGVVRGTIEKFFEILI